MYKFLSDKFKLNIVTVTVDCEHIVFCFIFNFYFFCVYVYRIKMMADILIWYKSLAFKLGKNRKCSYKLIYHLSQTLTIVKISWFCNEIHKWISVHTSNLNWQMKCVLFLIITVMIRFLAANYWYLIKLILVFKKNLS